MKPAIFIDAYLSSNDREQVFHKNVQNFIDHGYDVFIISNKISNFDKFDKVKYFEYDSRNRLLKDTTGYLLTSDSDYFRYKRRYTYSGSNVIRMLDLLSPLFNTTNLSVLYNTRRICEIVKEIGYTNILRVEYDCIFDRYDLENTILKGCETESWNNYGLATSGCFGIYTNWIYLNVDYFMDNIPSIKNEDQYKDFIIKKFGELKYLTFETILSSVLTNLKRISVVDMTKYLGNNTDTYSSDQSYNRYNFYSGRLLVTTVNNHTTLVIENQYDDKISVNVTRNDKTETFHLSNSEFYVFDIDPTEKICVKHKDHIKHIDMSIPCPNNFGSPTENDVLITKV
jgi:hypothetical protein